MSCWNNGPSGQWAFVFRIIGHQTNEQSPFNTARQLYIWYIITKLIAALNIVHSDYNCLSKTITYWFMNRENVIKLIQYRWCSAFKQCYTDLFISATYHLVSYPPQLCTIVHSIRKKNRRHYSLAGFSLRSISVLALCQHCERILAQDDFMWSSSHLHPSILSLSLSFNPSVSHSLHPSHCLSFTPSPLDFCPSGAHTSVSQTVHFSLSPSDSFICLLFCRV